MRKLATLILFAYFLAFSSMFISPVLADDDDAGGNADAEGAEAGAGESATPSTTTSTSKPSSTTLDFMCPFGKGGAGTTGGAWAKGSYDKTEAEAFNDDFTNKYKTELGRSECGKPNTTTGFLEKGDCSAQDTPQVVTEITEVLAPDTKLDDEKNKIITVYSGLCCFIGEPKDSGGYTCYDQRTIYTTSYTECSTKAQDCEKRQWIIGTSGVNIVKLMVKQIYTWGAITVGAIAVVTIIAQGIKISVSGVSGDITESKNKILQAIAGIVLLFLSALILYTINPEFFGPS